MSWRRAAALCLLLWGLARCGGSQPPPTPATIPTASGPTTITGAAEAARADLAARLGVAHEAIRVVEARSVEWPDGSVGCPQPGLGYAPLPQAGFLLLLEVAGRTYPYHGVVGLPLFLCETSPPAGL